ncbi:valine--tRNA ligase [Candidatus Marinamargulisbacteria bacterium SCGC AG-439-L15]|nr:valine--tRNA ligase [Candidatus Marinamargulisbacteria bacterium SCGC AG-439-L15]
MSDQNLQLEKAYAPEKMEADLYEWWEKEGHFKPSAEGTPFSVVVPPPNVTGVLHMGHALNITLQDIIIRYKRMTGHSVLWVPGTDHAGIATQNVVEKKLQENGVSRHDLGREEFIQKVWDWKQDYGSRITTQIRRLGASIDWSKERFTMDEGCQKAVLENFVKLYNDKLIYQGKYIVNWCPRCHTALSDIEVDFEDKNGSLWHIQYTAEEGTKIIVATTRPETLFGDTAVAVHPDDKRYQKLIGKSVTIPIAEKSIPIIADKHVEMTFGSGAVKVTPAHDPNDFAIGERHHLDRCLIMDESGIMNQSVPKKYQGLDRYACRKQLIQDLEETGALVKTEDHAHAVGHCYRCKTVIEPYLSKQWFIDMKKLVQPGIDAVRNKDIAIIPERWEKLYFEWMENIRDWCISRQIWWGHQLPVWYKKDDPDTIIVSTTPPENSEEYEQDPDVLDTWFSSALWPFSTLGWPEKTESLDKYYPTSLLVTGYDIMTFWVSRMITMGLYQMEEVPFDTVYIHGLVRDLSGRKMSKSIGNAIDPLKLIDSYGSDALRFSLASLSTLGGQDIKFSEEKVAASRNFANKLWNVSRFILMNLDEYNGNINISECPTSNTEIDEWILSCFHSTLATVNSCFDTYNYARGTEVLWDFIWNQFCDWYIEASKLNKEQSLPMVSYLLTQLLKLMHPYMPFITEKLWKTLSHHPKLDFTNETESISHSQWPKEDPSAIKSDLEQSISCLFDIIREVRHLRKTLNITPSKECKLIISGPTTKTILNHKALIKKLAKVSDIEKLSGSTPDNAASSVVQNSEIFIPLEGLVNVDEEKARLNKQVDSLEKELAFNNGKLNNKQFTEKAPEQVVQKIKDKRDQLQEELTLIHEQLKRFS